MSIHFRIKESPRYDGFGHQTEPVWSFQIELETPGGLQWFTLAKNRNRRALLAIVSANNLAVEIVRAEQ